MYGERFRSKTKTKRPAPKEKDQTMKNQFALTNVLPRPGRLGPPLAALMLLVAAALTSSAQVLPPSSLPYGYSYEEWSAKYWQ
jgi:hypothetical protein